MTRDELEKHNVGENLDALMCLDPRGYGVCRILYAGSRAYTGEPIAMHAAEQLCKTVKAGDVVYIIVGFVLLPHKVPEMDGSVSSILLARALVLAFGAKPVIICPEDSVEAFKKCANVVGLHCYEDLDICRQLPLSMGIVSFTKEKDNAKKQADDLINSCKPTAVISIEACSANKKGVYHNAIGQNVSDFQAKSDILWNELCKRNILNIAIGDLGNEIGMATIAEHIKKYVPFTAKNECKCGCTGGILSDTSTDNIITATCSDWGCYALMASLAYLKKDMNILHNEDMESEVMRVLSRNGMIDMTGSLLPGVDGFDTRMNVSIVSLMRQCTDYAVHYSKNSEHWFEPVLNKGFFKQ